MLRVGKCPARPHKPSRSGASPLPATMSTAQLETLYDAAIAAMESGDFSTAILKLMAIKTRLAITPNLEKSVGGNGTSSITWNATSVTEIDNLISQCRRLQSQASRSGVLQQTKVVYARPGVIE